MIPVLMLAALSAAGTTFPTVVTIRRERVPGVTELSTGVVISRRHVAALTVFAGPGTPFVEYGDELVAPDTVHLCPDLGIAVMCFGPGSFEGYSTLSPELPGPGDSVMLVGQGVTGLVTVAATVERLQDDGLVLLSAPRMEGLMGACAFDREDGLVGIVTGLVPARRDASFAPLTDHLALMPTQMWYIWADLAMDGSPRPEEPFGVTATSCSASGDRPAGILIVAVDDGSTACRCGLRPGDVVTRVDTVRTYHPESLRGLLMQARDSIETEVWSRGGPRTLMLPPLR